MVALLSCRHDPDVSGRGDRGSVPRSRHQGGPSSAPAKLWSLASRKLDAIDQAGDVGDLRVPPGNRLEALRGDRDGQHSIRINNQYRICFRWTESGPDEVEIVDYH
jgi:proteic killer suppression protein